MSEAKSRRLALLPPVLRLLLAATLRDCVRAKVPPGEVPENDPERTREGVCDPVNKSTYDTG